MIVAALGADVVHVDSTALPVKDSMCSAEESILRSGRRRPSPSPIRSAPSEARDLRQPHLGHRQGTVTGALRGYVGDRDYAVYLHTGTGKKLGPCEDEIGPEEFVVARKGYVVISWSGGDRNCAIACSAQWPCAEPETCRSAILAEFKRHRGRARRTGTHQVQVVTSLPCEKSSTAKPRCCCAYWTDSPWMPSKLCASHR